ncbi:DUF2469 family protein [Nocardioides immobilis]|uniref:DUF2469 family protein n=1 Tax=Nocardioides immobilis TaxID=2049295 RepID=UPI001FE9EDCF|nr:DUF2469 family protein [Nocardioides immobilis]
MKARTESVRFFEVTISDTWVWEMYRPARFAKNVNALTFKVVNDEELKLANSDIEPPNN